jgi:DNA-binding CsgD family transcriptional regulator
MAKRDGTTRVRPYQPLEAIDESNVPCLEALSGSIAGQLVRLQQGENLIGRTSSGVVALEDDGVSRRHAKVQVSLDGMATLFDLESTNGTFVNGARISRIGLREGDRIQIGPAVAFRFGYRSGRELRAGAAAGQRAEEPAEPVEPTPLTARELEIAKLVVEGLSNDEIGARLYISPRTVGTHLTNIYKRLEIHTRAELTRYVLERGLLGEQRS